MPGQKAYLRILNGPQKGGVFVLAELSVFEIGRGEGCQVPIDDPYVAFNHARIYRKDETWTFFDLNSERGSSINDIKVEKRELAGLEVIRIGKTEMLFSFEPPTGKKGSPPASAPAAAAPPSPAAAAVPAPVPPAAPESAAPTEPPSDHDAPEVAATLDDSVDLAPTVPCALDGGSRLVVVDGDSEDKGKSIALRGRDAITVGRGGKCEFILSDRKVSRAHCRLEARDGAVVLIDLGSSNGTIVNGDRVEKTVLRSGDYIRLGYTVLSLQSVPNPVGA